MCLAIVVWLFVSPSEEEGYQVEVQVSSGVACENRPPVLEGGRSYVFGRTQWQTIVGLYGVYHFGWLGGLNLRGWR